MGPKASPFRAVRGAAAAAPALGRVGAFAMGLLAPPRCGICACVCTPAEHVCAPCRSALRPETPRSTRIPGIDGAWSAVPHAAHARRLVLALKYRRLRRLAVVAAEVIDGLPASPPDAVLVPVPASPARLRQRGLDPAAEIAAALARLSDRRPEQPLAREDGPRQVGRQRLERLADPPVVRATGAAPSVAVLVDDVVTTGATLAACAAALRSAGARSVQARTLAWA